MKEFTEQEIIEGNKKIAIFNNFPTALTCTQIDDRLASSLSYQKSFDALMPAIKQLDDMLYYLMCENEYDGEGEIGNAIWEMWANELEDSSLYFTRNQLFTSCIIEEVYSDVLKSIDFLEKHKENIKAIISFTNK